MNISDAHSSQNINEINGVHAIFNESGRELPLQRLHARIEKLYQYIGEENSDVSIVLTTDDEIKRLNAQWRNIDETTDVLSFPMREGELPQIAKKLPLGDVAISVDTALRYVDSCAHKQRLDAQTQYPVTCHWSILDELTFLVIHSTLHLLGYDHALPDEEKTMRALERKWMDFVLASENSQKTTDNDDFRDPFAVL